MSSACVMLSPEVSAKYQYLTLYIGRQHITSGHSHSNETNFCTDSTAESHTHSTGECPPHPARVP
jgi:hypothetical protein